MLVAEMHIHIDEKLQKLNTNLYDNISTEQKDLFLTLAQERIVKRRINPLTDLKGKGFEDTIKRYDDIQSIVMTKKIKPRYHNEESMYLQLPDDYMFYVNSESKTAYNCNSVTFNIVDKSEKLFKFNVNLNNPNDNNGFKIEIGGQVLITFAVADVLYTNPFNSFVDEDEIYVLITDILSSIRFKDNYELYFQKYDNVDLSYSDDSFILKYVGNNTSIAASSGIKVTTFSTSEIFNAIVNNYKEVSHSYTSFKTSDDRLIDTQHLRQVLNKSFTKTKYNSVVTNIQNNKLYLYYDKTFIIDEVNLTYIRTPRRINKFLNLHCELPEHLHSEIVDEAVLLISHYIEKNNIADIIQINSQLND